MKTCKNWADIVASAQSRAWVEGIFQSYTPNARGKGAGHMFWDWEIRLSDGTSLPLIFVEGAKAPLEWVGKRVRVQGTVFYGIVIGDPRGQYATGYRLDAVEMEKA